MVEFDAAKIVGMAGAGRLDRGQPSATFGAGNARCPGYARAAVCTCRGKLMMIKAAVVKRYHCSIAPIDGYAKLTTKFTKQAEQRRNSS